MCGTWSAQEGSKAHSRFTRSCREAGNLLTRSLSLTAVGWHCFLFREGERQHSNTYTRLIRVHTHTHTLTGWLTDSDWLTLFESTAIFLQHLTSITLRTVLFVPAFISFLLYSLLTLCRPHHTHRLAFFITLCRDRHRHRHRRTHTHVDSPIHNRHCYLCILSVPINIYLLFFSSSLFLLLFQLPLKSSIFSSGFCTIFFYSACLRETKLNGEETDDSEETK